MATKKKSSRARALVKWKDRGDGSPIVVGGGGGNKRRKKLTDEYAYTEFADSDYPIPADPDQKMKVRFVQAANASIDSLDLKIGSRAPIDLMGFLVSNSFLEIHCGTKRERIRITTDPLSIEYHPSDYAKVSAKRHEKTGTTVDSVHINGDSDETVLKRGNKSAIWTITARARITKRRAKR